VRGQAVRTAGTIGPAVTRSGCSASPAQAALPGSLAHDPLREWQRSLAVTLATRAQSADTTRSSSSSWTMRSILLQLSRQTSEQRRQTQHCAQYRGFGSAHDAQEARGQALRLFCTSSLTRCADNSFGLVEPGERSSLYLALTRSAFCSSSFLRGTSPTYDQ
jgi:hypothetical protein